MSTRNRKYRPDLSDSISMIILKPTHENISGVRKKLFPSIEDAIKDESNFFYGSFRTYGGTETTINGIFSIEDTAIISTWYRPDIKSGCRIALITGEIYDILNEPENINKRNQFMTFKVRRVKGGS